MGMKFTELETLNNVAADFEAYYSKIRGMGVAALGIDMAENHEIGCKTAFFAGYACGMLAAEKTILNPSKED